MKLYMPHPIFTVGSSLLLASKQDAKRIIFIPCYSVPLKSNNPIKLLTI